MLLYLKAFMPNAFTSQSPMTYKSSQSQTTKYITIFCNLFHELHYNINAFAQ